MAVPKERLSGRLKAYLTSKAITNLSNTRIDEFSARLCSLPADDADDAAIDLVISNSDAVFPFKDVASADDKIRTLETQLKKPDTKSKEELEAEAKAKADAEALEAAKKAGDQPEWVKALMAKLDAQDAKITELQTGKVLETKKATAAELFGKSDVLKGIKDEFKANWLARINVDSETPIQDQVTALETEYTGLQQSFAESGNYSGTPPLNGNGTVKANQAEIDKIVDSMNL